MECVQIEWSRDLSFFQLLFCFGGNLTGNLDRREGSCGRWPVAPLMTLFGWGGSQINLGSSVGDGTESIGKTRDPVELR